MADRPRDRTGDERGTMSGQEGFEAWLGELETRTYSSSEEATVDMAELVLRTNVEIEELRRAGTAELPWDKIREWIKRAVEFIKEIAKKLGALHYSIGVSLTGLSASIEWSGTIP